MRLSVFSLVVLLGLLIGCENPDDEYLRGDKELSSQQTSSVNEKRLGENNGRSSSEQDERRFKPFYVFSNAGARDNHYVPSGFMPNGKCLKFQGSWRENCFSGSTCLKIDFDVECSREDQRWGGIYWLNPPNNWGSRKGGYNLTGAEQLTFWAKGSRGGEQIEEFKVGGIEGNYPDSDVAVIGPVILSSEWKKYAIDLRGKDLSYISGGFAWSANEEMNSGSCSFFIDEIRFE